MSTKVASYDQDLTNTTAQELLQQYHAVLTHQNAQAPKGAEIYCAIGFDNEQGDTRCLILSLPHEEIEQLQQVEQCSN